MQEQITHPINAFPEYFQDIIAHYSEAKGYPIEYFLTSALAAVSTSAGRSITLNTGNYTAIGSIWCIILGRKGFTKSEPLDDAFRPVREYQFKILDRYAIEEQEYKHMLTQLKKGEVAPELAPCPKTVLSDTTPEALVMALAANQKGCGQVYDEISGLVNRFNRYNASADEEMYLSLFNGGSIMRERIKSSSNAYAKTSYLTIIGTTQPTTLKNVFFNKSESGFFDRWLISQPETVKKQYPNAIGIDPNVQARYKFILDNLLELGYDERKFHQLQYSQESYDIIHEYQCAIIDEENDTNDDNLRGILAKMEIYLHKFSLLLALVDYGIAPDRWTGYVSEHNAKGAIILTKYFISQAQSVRVMSPIETLKDLWKELYTQLPEHGINFTRLEFVKKAAQFGIGQRNADNFLKENSERSENKLLFKVNHGIYTKNLF